MNTFLRGHVLQDHLDGNKDIDASVTRALGIAASQCLTQLQSEANALSNQEKRTGKAPTLKSNTVRFGISQAANQLWETGLDIHEQRWNAIDLGDCLPWGDSQPTLVDDLLGPTVEKKQCLLIHASAGTIVQQAGKTLQLRAKSRKMALIMRSDVYCQGEDCFDTIGDPEQENPLLLAELKARARDSFRKNHDKDNRSLLCFHPWAF